MKIKLIAMLASFLIAISGAVLAQDQDDPSQDSQPLSQDNQPASQDSQPPSQDNNAGVARISLLHGDVSTRRGDSGEWSAATLNAPVVAGDQVSVGDHSRAELQLDYANVLRLDEHAQVNLSGLDRNQIQIQLGQGRVNFTVLKDSQANVEIDTPNVAVHPDRRDGSYSVNLNSDGRTEVIVRRGSVDISTPQGSTPVESGQMITVMGAGEDTQYKKSGAPDRDDFDRWASDRDHTIQNAQSWHHTNGYYTGSEDLDAYGSWKDVPDYGSVWVPTVGADWAPYRAGQWVWEPGWGWTWVSYEPWGWAPYHYGRWMYVGGSWGWWPGPVYGNPYYNPIWAPAYVSFFGFGGGGWGVGFGFGGGWGSIGWLPVGPCDRFYPWWGGYRSRYNVVNIHNVNIYNNRGGWGALHGGTSYSNIRHAINDPGFRRSLSTVRANEFGRGRMAVQPANNEMFRNANLVSGNLPVVPSRQSLSASGRPAAPSTISNRMQNEHFFSKTRPAAGRPMSFEKEQAQMQNNIRQNSRIAAISGDRGNMGNQRSTANEGNSRFGGSSRPGMNSSPANEARRPETSRPGNGGASNGSNSDWRHFGGPSGQNSATNNSPRPSEPVGRSQGNSTWNSAPRPLAGGSRPPESGTMSRNSQNETWRNPPRSSGPESRGGYSSQSRPPLNMRQPIVTPRSGDSGRPSYGRPSYGGAPYGGSRGGYSEPPRGYPSPSRGGYSAPAPSRGGYSAPAPSRGGYSAPAPSGGGYSAPRGGGYSAPSSHGGGGSSHSSGGGSSHGGGGSSHSNSNSGHHGR